MTTGTTAGLFPADDPGLRRRTILSCGGGVQSTAVIGQIIKGILPKPDYVVMADTEREKASTWRYVNGVLIPKLAEAGIALEIIPKSQYATVDLWGGADGKTLLLPCYTTASGDDIGKMSNFCSGEWKKRVIARYMWQVHRVRAWEAWLGMSTDEMSRVRVKDQETGTRNWYPLVFGPRPMNRLQCLAFVVIELGWPPPPKTACWMCSNMSNDQWRDMRDNEPEDWARAVALDYKIREVDPHAFLHRSGVPLDLADLGSDETGPSSEGCDSGYCFV